MNKYQEALDNIGKYAYDHDLYESINTLQELVELATPKKPTFNVDAYHFCPTCIDRNWRTMTSCYDYLIGPDTLYCRRCGQRIDWSDYEQVL